MLSLVEISFQISIVALMKESCKKKQTIFRNSIQNINTLIYIKLVTYCCSNLIYLTRTLQLFKKKKKKDSERQIRSLTFFSSIG